MNPKLVTEPVEKNDVPRYRDEVAVGEDLEFQRKWWRFENGVWIFFFAVLICDGLGLLGRGWLSKTEVSSKDQALQLKYERIERAYTPSVMTFQLSPAAIHNGQVKLYISDSVVKQLGAARISPQPLTSTIGSGGITYVFPATVAPATVQISLEPQNSGLRHFRVRVSGSEPIDSSIFVFP